jgi:sodium transport system permease protein
MVTEESYKIAIVNNQDEIKTVLDSFNNNPDAEYSIDYIRIDFESIDIYKTKIDDGEWDLLVVFSEGIDTYDGTGDKPTIYLYHNPNEIASSTIYSDMYNIFVEYENAKSLELYGDRTYLDFVYDSSPLDENGFVGRLIGSLIPMLIIMFLFSGAMSIGPESIAGEKERGTIATQY